MRRLAARAVTVPMPVLAAAQPAAAVPQLLMVRNSGWMEPFHSDSDSQLKPLVAALAQTLGRSGGDLQLLQVNRSTATHRSPVRVAGGDGATVAAAVPRLQLQRKGSGPTYADTDFLEALGSAVREYLGTRPGLIWMVSNNKNSPNSDHRTAARNLDFYRFVHDAPHSSYRRWS